jgi:hypothetical protein
MLNTNMFNHVPIRHKQTLLVSNGGKFKLYIVPNGLLFSTLIRLRFSFERTILQMKYYGNQIRYLRKC